MATQLPIALVDKLGTPFSVRELDGPQDRDSLHRMYADFLPRRAAQGLPPESDYAISRWLDHILKAGQHLLVEVAGEVRGHLMLIPMDKDNGTELAIFLHQSIRGRGIGTAMNRLAVTLSREAGFSRIWLSVEPTNMPAIRSYQKAGFKTLAHSVWASEIEMEIAL